MLKLKNIGLALLLAVVSIGIACDGQTNEANKLIDEANATIKKSNELSTKAGALTISLLGADALKSIEDLEKYKTDNKAKFDESLKLSEDAAKGFEEAAGKFDQVSKMKLDDKLKEYNGLMSQQLKKITEISKEEATLIKGFLAEKDPEKIGTMMSNFNTKSADLKKEAAAIKEKGDKIVKDNPSVFKS